MTPVRRRAPCDLRVRVADLAEDLGRVLARPQAGRADASRARRRTRAGAPAGAAPGSSRARAAGACRVPRVCSASATSATSATGRRRDPGGGQPRAPVGRVRSRRRAETSATSASRLRTRSGFVRKRVVRDELGQPEHVAEQARTGDRFRRRPSARRRAWGRPGTARPSGTPFPVRSERFRPRGSRRGGSRCSRARSRRATCRRRAPSPVRSRSSSAATIPSADHIPVPMSMRDEPTRTPGRPGSPVMLISPPAACMSAS